MIANQQAPVHVIEAGLCERVQDLVRDHQRLAVGAKGQAADIVRRQRPQHFDRALLGIDDRQLAAKGIGDNQPGTISRPWPTLAGKTACRACRELDSAAARADTPVLPAR